MNENPISKLCKQLNLGSPTNEISPVTGGLLHLMWKLDTTKGSYAIKQLSKDIALTTQIKKSYELTEKISDKFKQHGIPAISALEVKGQHLIEIEDTAYLVYPWVNAKALDKDAVSDKHALSISSLLARMHLLNLHFPEIESPKFDIHSDDKIIHLINNSIDCRCTFASSLKANQDRIISINHSYQNAIPLIKENVVISHGDLDQKNVLWDQDDTPVLIDWESARKLNPTYEIVNAALDWSGITTDNFNMILFVEMIKAYQDAGGIIDKKHLQASFYGVLGNWLNWMVYNISRACNPDDSEQQKIGTEQVEQVISTIIRLEQIIPTLNAKANTMLKEISELNIIQDPHFTKIAGVKHAFFTRQGGVSTGVHASLNCCYRGLDSPLNVQENRKRVMSSLGLPFESLVTTVNVHSNNVVTVNEPWNESNLPEADGMVTHLKNVVLASDSADCPIVLFADNTSGVIGLAHAGWKSAFAGILEQTLNAMLALGAKSHQISTVIGPCILQPSYEVSSAFYEHFIAHSSLNELFFINSKNDGHKLFDLLGFVREKLNKLNLHQISEIGLDTYTNEDLFFSCRRATHRKEEDFGGHFSCIYMHSNMNI